VDTGQRARLDGLLGHWEGAGDDGLGSDDRGDRGQGEHGPVGELGHHRPERVLGGGRGVEDQGALAQIVQGQAGQDEAQPAHADRRLTEMAHVGVERLGPGHRQEDAAQDDEAEKAVVDQQHDAVVRRQGAQDREVVEDVIEAQRP